VQLLAVAMVDINSNVCDFNLAFHTLAFKIQVESNVLFDTQCGTHLPILRSGLDIWGQQ
jgi:hypothetical protein